MVGDAHINYSSFLMPVALIRRARPNVPSMPALGNFTGPAEGPAANLYIRMAINQIY